MINLEEALRRAHQIANRVEVAIEGKPVDATDRKMLAGTAFQLSTEHHRGMIILIETGTLGPALALTRSVIETFARGHWLCYMASEAEVARFARGVLTMNLGNLLKKVAKQNPDGPTLKTLTDAASRAHDLTHGGIGHLARRMRPGRLGPSYKEDEIVASLNIASLMASMSALDLVGTVIGDETLATSLTNEFRLLNLPH